MALVDDLRDYIALHGTAAPDVAAWQGPVIVGEIHQFLKSGDAPIRSILSVRVLREILKNLRFRYFANESFYNAGPVAGASQRHKHLQLIPLSASNGPRLPIEPLLRFVQMAGATGTVPRLPFLHAYAPMDPGWTNPQKDSGASFLACYRSLLRAAGLSVDATAGSRAPTAPYNLLATRRWLLLVPRSQECFEGISINALGFAGALLVKDAVQLDLLRKRGPMTALERVAFPRKS